MILGSRALFRVVVIAGAWAAGEAIGFALGLGDGSRLLGLALAVAAYFLTRGGAVMGARRRGQVKYWRGRPVDDSDWRH